MSTEHTDHIARKDAAAVKRAEAELVELDKALDWLIPYLVAAGGTALAMTTTKAAAEAGITRRWLLRAQSCCSWINDTEQGFEWELWPGLGC